MLTYDSREGLTTVYDGLVYREEEGAKYVLMDGYCQAAEGVLRTSLLLPKNGLFRCLHNWDEVGSGNPTALQRREAVLKVSDGMLAIQTKVSDCASVYTNTVLVDLRLDIEFKDPEQRDLWDHLLSD